MTTAAPLPFRVRVRHGVRQPHNWLQLVRFAAVGASGYVVNLATFAAVRAPVGIDYRLSSVIAFVVSVVNNFWLNRHWTFDAQARASDVPGRPFLRGVAGRVRLHVRDADHAGRRRRDAEGGRRRRSRSPPPRRCRSSGRSSGASGPSRERSLCCGRHRRASLAVAPTALAAAGTAGTTSAAITDATRRPARRSIRTPRCWSPSQNKPPPGYRLTAAKVERDRGRLAEDHAELRRHPERRSLRVHQGPGRWQVSWFSTGHRASELAQVYVDDASGKVTEAWTGFQVAWTMARGYPGAFGRRVNALVRVASAVRAVPGAVPAVAPPAVAAAPRPAGAAGVLGLAGVLQPRARSGSRCRSRIRSCCTCWCGCCCWRSGADARASRCACSCRRRGWRSRSIFLVGFRVGLNVTDSNVIDVGYAGVIGADKLVHGQQLYGGWP